MQRLRAVQDGTPELPEQLPDQPRLANDEDDDESDKEYSPSDESDTESSGNEVSDNECAAPVQEVSTPAQEPPAAQATKTKRNNRRSQKQQAASKRARQKGTSHSRNKTWQARDVGPAGGVCPHCAVCMVKIVEACKPALRTRTELNKHPNGHAYNYNRLKSCLLSAAINIDGEFQVHGECLAYEFDIERRTLGRLRKFAVEQSGRRWVAVTKAYVKVHKLQSQVLVPDDHADKTTLQYLDSIGDEVKVDIVYSATGQSLHGLYGRKSNNKNDTLRSMFEEICRKICQKFVKMDKGE